MNEKLVRYQLLENEANTIKHPLFSYNSNKNLCISLNTLFLFYMILFKIPNKKQGYFYKHVYYLIMRLLKIINKNVYFSPPLEFLCLKIPNVKFLSHLTISCHVINIGPVLQVNDENIFSGIKCALNVECK